MNQATTGDSCVFVILGATGDLTKRKLIPAIYNLVASGKLHNFALVGAALMATDMRQVLELARPFVPDCQDEYWDKLQRAAYYYRMDFHEKPAYAGLHELIARVEQEHQLMGNRLFYLATMPHHFMVITEQLAEHGIVKRHQTAENKPWERVVYEKPFGDSLASARQINQAIARVFDERQVFRIDHYLGKELVGNIALARFTNTIFEPLWNHNYIESVQIVLSETMGINGRGKFYDAYGTLKDVVQNHMLQILALVGMEMPKRFEPEYLRDAKARLLERVRVENVILGQYAGYQQEPEVNPTSTTDTFAALKLAIDTPRWQGVPFYLKAGKCLANNGVAVHIKFKMAECLLDFCPTDSNYLTINIQPHEGMRLELNVKTPGVFNHVTPVNMDFSHGTLFGFNTPAAYEILLADVVRGDHFVFVRADEIDYAWSIIQQALALKPMLQGYARGSNGPDTATLLDQTREIRWKT